MMWFEEKVINRLLRLEDNLTIKRISEIYERCENW
ncbi:MAG: hypothetical protein QG670_782 [Thermoproteota archaeon]|nr:hypothetical protein [Thermoproteota archaeon]